MRPEGPDRHRLRTVLLATTIFVVLVLLYLKHYRPQAFIYMQF